MSRGATDQVAREILSYFVRNPHAGDTLEGIARWRLLNEIVSRKVDETQAALARLVECGLLVQVSQPGVEPIYMLDPDRRRDAERLLEASEPPGLELHGPSSDDPPCP